MRRIKAAGDLELIRKLNACSLRIDVFIAATESCSFQQRVKKWKRKEGKREEKREEYIYTLRDIEWKDNGGKKGGEWEHLLATITSA